MLLLTPPQACDTFGYLQTLLRLVWENWNRRHNFVAMIIFIRCLFSTLFVYAGRSVQLYNDIAVTETSLIIYKDKFFLVPTDMFRWRPEKGVIFVWGLVKGKAKTVIMFTSHFLSKTRTITTGKWISLTSRYATI